MTFCHFFLYFIIVTFDVILELYPFIVFMIVVIFTYSENWRTIKLFPRYCCHQHDICMWYWWPLFSRKLSCQLFIHSLYIMISQNKVAYNSFHDRTLCSYVHDQPSISYNWNQWMIETVCQYDSLKYCKLRRYRARSFKEGDNWWFIFMKNLYGPCSCYGTIN